MNRSFENGGYRSTEPSEEEKVIEANWGKDFHAVNNAVGQWVMRIARQKDGVLDATLRAKLVEQAEAVLRANSDDDSDSKASPANITFQLRRLFEPAI